MPLAGNEFLVIMFLRYKNVAMKTDQCVSLVHYNYICSCQEYNALPWKHNNVLSLVIFSGGGSGVTAHEMYVLIFSKVFVILL